MRLVGVLVVFLVTLASPTLAQIISAVISGTITDETGGVLPGVDVVVTNIDTGLTRSTVTDSNGYFAVPGLAPGTYETRAGLQGFTTAVQTGIVPEVSQQAGLNLTLRAGAASESITVTGETPLVDVRTSSLPAVVDEKTIEELPLNGRNYMTLATLQPGIVQFTEKSGAGSATRGVRLNINGMGGRSNSYLIDGATMKGTPASRRSPPPTRRSASKRSASAPTCCTGRPSSSSTTAGWTRATSSTSGNPAPHHPYRQHRETDSARREADLLGGPCASTD